MELNKILSADVLDIIFDGRNKDYGAYDLRKSYNKRITYALAGTLSIILFLYISSILASKIKHTAKAEIVVQDVVLDDVKKEDKKAAEPPPPPPPPKQEPPKVEIAKFTPPKIVKEEVKEDEKPPEQDKLEGTKIGNINQEGAKDEGVVAAPVSAGGTGTVEAPKVEEDYDKVFTDVSIQSEFPGGPTAWVKYLQRNLNAETPSSNGAPPGKYTVVISFKVDKTGAISEITADNDPGYGTKEEAIRVIRKGPSWKPANQNGRIVTSIKKQAITFQVNEE